MSHKTHMRHPDEGKNSRVALCGRLGKEVTSDAEEVTCKACNNEILKQYWNFK